MRKQNRVALWAGRARHAADLPQRQRRRPDPGRDGLALLGAAVRLQARSSQAPEGRPEMPRLIAVVGASFGDSALHAAMGHFVVMTKDSALALSGPPVIAAAIGEELTADELGGPKVSSAQSGNAHLVVDDEVAALAAIKRVLSYLPDSADHPAPPAAGRRARARRRGAAHARAERPAARLRHAQGARGDLRRRHASSRGPSGTAPASSARLARIEGEAVGVVASQPMQRAGVMDVPALTKEAAFVDLCDTFNLPLVFLQDVPGPDDRLRRRARRHPRRLRAGRRAARPRQGAEDRGRRAQGLRRRPLRARRAARRTPTSSSPGRRRRWASWRRRRASAPSTGAGSRRCSRRRARRRTTRSSRSSPPTGRGSPSPGRRRRTPTSTT